MLCFYGCLYFWCHFLKIMVLHQAMCLLYPASCIITHKLETVSIKLRQLLTVIYNWQYFPSPRKSELSELRIQDRLLTRDTGFNHCHLETRTIHWDQTIIPGRLLFSVLFLNSGRQWEQCRVSAQSDLNKVVRQIYNIEKEDTRAAMIFREIFHNIQRRPLNNEDFILFLHSGGTVEDREAF